MAQSPQRPDAIRRARMVMAHRPAGRARRRAFEATHNTTGRQHLRAFDAPSASRERRPPAAGPPACRRGRAPHRRRRADRPHPPSEPAARSHAARSGADGVAVERDLVPPEPSDGRRDRSCEITWPPPADVTCVDACEQPSGGTAVAADRAGGQWTIEPERVLPRDAVLHSTRRCRRRGVGGSAPNRGAYARWSGIATGDGSPRARIASAARGEGTGGLRR